MKLLTQEILDRFKKTGNQSESDDPIVICKFFNPTGAGTWFATEYDPETRIFFGFAHIHEGEWGSFALDELESVKVRFGLKIERDISFKPGRFSEVVPAMYK